MLNLKQLLKFKVLNPSDENQIPVMPMLHVLSTHGLLLSFDLLNLQPSQPGLCSPPQPLADKSGAQLFTELLVNSTQSQSFAETPPQQQQSQQVFKTPSSNDPQSNLTFNIPDSGATSTPTKPVGNVQAPSKNLFGSLGAANTNAGSISFGANSSLTFGTKPQAGLGFGDANKQTSGTKTADSPFGTQPKALQSPALTAALLAQPSQKAAQPPTVQPRTTEDQTKPFITVPPAYTPPASLNAK